MQLHFFFKGNNNMSESRLCTQGPLAVSPFPSTSSFQNDVDFYLLYSCFITFLYYLIELLLNQFSFFLLHPTLLCPLAPPLAFLFLADSPSSSSHLLHPAAKPPHYHLLLKFLQQHHQHSSRHPQTHLLPQQRLTSQRPPPRPPMTSQPPPSSLSCCQMPPPLPPPLPWAGFPLRTQPR